VNEDPEYSRQFPGKIPCRIEIRTSREKSWWLMSTIRVAQRNPMTDEEVSHKSEARWAQLDKGQVEVVPSR